MGYGDFKRDVGDAVVAMLEPIQGRYREIRSDEAGLRRALQDGAARARSMAGAMLDTMYDRMGFVRP